MSSSTSPSPSTAELKKVNESKPVKLRSACNCCFAAKVRCDGNKEGCKRCSEKHLDCTYSESMVGKVVGKRRKRPLPDSRLNDCKANPWTVTVGPTTMPSPASTYISDQPNKRNCVSNDWTTLISYDEQSPIDYSGCDEQFLNLDLCQESNSVVLNDTSTSIPTNTGLPTPSMSPPDTQFLSPSDLEASAQSILHDASLYSESRSDQYPADCTFKRPHLGEVEDDEIVCIKLLAHLKRCSSRAQQSPQAVSSLICKTNTAIKRLLRSRLVRTDYACHLLLTNIMMHLASICEQLLNFQSSRTKMYPEQEFINECYLTNNDQESCRGTGVIEATGPDFATPAKTALSESTLLCSNVGDLLKRKPLHGFQVLGRHESALIEIESRLKRVTAALS